MCMAHVSLYAYNYGHKSESVFAITIFTLVPQMCNCQFASANAGCAGGQVATNCAELSSIRVKNVQLKFIVEACSAS